MSKNWTPRKISAFCNKLIRLLKQAGIHVHRFDISKWGQAVLNIGDSFVAGLDFPCPGEITCTAGGFMTRHDAGDLPSIVRRLKANLTEVKRRTPAGESKPVRLEVRSNRPL